MKPISFVCVLFLFAQQSIAQNSSATPFDKLKASFDAAFKPTDVASVMKRIASIRDCAGASSTAPESMNRMMIPFRAVHTTESFGPDFPSVTYTGIGFLESRDISTSVGESFFTDYNESFIKNSLRLKSSKFYEKAECDSAGDCWNYTTSRPVIVDIRLSEKYVHYNSETAFAYCW